MRKFSFFTVLRVLRVPLYLCLLNISILGSSPETSHVTAPVAANSSPHKVILCLGDSLTAGYGLDKAEAYPALLQKKIDTLGLHFEVVNAGLSGETSAGGLRRLDWFLKRKIDVLILALGGNDALRGIPLDATKKYLDDILSKTQARYPDAKLIIAGMLIPTNWGHEYFNGFRALFPELAAKHKAQLIPFLLDGVGGKAELNFPDGIHPTSEGHQIVAENVWKVLKPVLNSIR